MGKPRLLFEGRFAPGNIAGRRYDLAPDGRFLMIQGNEPPPTEIRVMLNWLED